MSFESLNFQDHLDFYKRHFRCEEKPSEYAIRQAWCTHAVAIFNPLRDLSLETVQLSERMSSKDAAIFLKYGVSKRLLAIWYSYRTITSIAHPERTEPLTENESHELDNVINLIYMHLRGVLDNYAWAYLYEKEPALLQDNNGKARKLIGLFNDDFKKNSNKKDFWNEINEYKTWSTELSAKRDPVAHRIPLYVVPSILTHEQHETYQKLEQEYSEALSIMDFEKIDALFPALRSLGVLPMQFAHNPDENPFPIYPTIPSDMANLIKIQKIILKYLL